MAIFYEFGQFRFAPQRRSLLRSGEAVTVQPKALELLAVLLERRGQELEKDVLIDLLWPNQAVEESNLTVTMSVLRKALGERAQSPEFILTLPGRGYRFVGDVREVGDEPETLVIQQSRVSIVVEEEEDDGKVERLGDSEMGRKEHLLTPSPPRFVTPSRLAIATLSLVLLTGGGYWWRTRQSAISAPQSTIKTLAVLPFKTLNPATQENILGVGLTDVMITRLSNVGSLAVRPTNSVLRFTDQDPLQAGRDLRVDTVLDGSVQQIGDRVRVTMRLLRVSDGQPLWAYQCDEFCNDVFKLQDTISEQVTGKLALQLTGAERQRMTRRYTDNLAAYQAYLRGRYHTLQFTPEGNRQAIAELNEALRLDPNYALAYAGLADAYTGASEWLLAPREALGQARAAAEKALALDDTLAEAHAALGHVMLHQFNPAAETQFQRALELSPNSVAARFFYSEYFAFAANDAGKAIENLRRVQQLDPLSPTAGSFIVWAYLIARRNDEALREAKKTLEIEPQNPFSRLMLALAESALGKRAEAIAELEKLKPMMPTSQLMGALGREYALAGRRDDALKALGELNQMAKQQYISPFDLALIYTALGDKDQAFAYLEKAREDQSEWLGLLDRDARLDSLRTDARLVGLLRHVGGK